jgi:hypothetical protein
MDNLPFEELEPCCQKEILANKKAAKLKKQLRRHDRSIRRTDLISRVFSTVANDSVCACCHEYDDYPLLQAVKNMKSQQEDHNNEHDSMSDDDELDMDFQTDYEIELRRSAEETRFNIRRMGYSVHVEDSFDHVLSNINNHDLVVLHVFDPQSQMCAWLDMVLEGIAIKYIGTKFRRITYKNALLLYKKIQQTNLSDVSKLPNDIKEMRPYILPFVDGVLKQTAPVEQFISMTNNNNNHVLERDLIQYLDYNHVLSIDIKINLNCLNNTISDKINYDDNDEHESDYDSDDDNEKYQYCDLPNCDRNYAHSHILGGDINDENMSSSVRKKDLSGSIFTDKVGGDDNSDDNEILSKNYFLKI